MTEQNTCPFSVHPDIQILSTASLLFTKALSAVLFSIVVGHAASGIPINHLGRRPTGNGLISYLYNHLRYRVGVKGYDSSLGAYAPPIRLFLHVANFVALWAALLCVLEFGKWALVAVWMHDGLCIQKKSMQQVQDVGILAMAIFFFCWYLSDKYCKVSDPGGPREHKIRRVPMWDQMVTNYEDDAGNVKWRCAVANDSHEVTETKFEIGKKSKIGSVGQKQAVGLVSGHGPDGKKEVIKKALTGEPSGRQIWTCEDTMIYYQESKSIYVNNNAVEEMAAGGRSWGFDPSVNPNSSDKLFRAQQIRSYIASGKSPPSLDSKPKTASEAAKKAAHFYSMLQSEDGHWAGDYGGPHFLMPGIVISWYCMGQPDLMLDKHQCAAMRHYLLIHQQSDGGWGTHVESPSTMFGTVLCYVTIRLLGEEVDSKVSIKGREFIKKEGGAIMASSWAKFWLCVLGCMEWEGHNSVPPEMWLLPNWVPFHPGRLWCHCRMVYLPMGYLYGSQFVYSKAETDPLILSLRKELYCQPYRSIPWSKTNNLISPMDNYSPIPKIMKILQTILAIYESWRILQPLKKFMRGFGLKFCLEYMAAEDLQTNFINIGPVNKALNMLSAYHAMDNDINHPTVQNHMMRVPDYLWLAEDGMKMQGYNGSQCWDTSFAIQAMAECNLLDMFPLVSKKVWTYLERSQILSTDVSKKSPAFIFETSSNRDRFYRHVSEGGWPFSTSAHGWPISDCTGEGLKGVLALLHCQTVSIGIKNDSLRPISDQRLYNAVNVLLTLQNEDGGWATYENNRGFGWYEQLNPSEVFGDIMIDYSYVECSMASLTALVEFQKLYPTHRSHEINFSIKHGREFMKSIQRDDGSWYGSWACCFSYGCWFGIEGLITAGESPSSPTIQKCCEFLLAHQRDNGGWGEDFTSCYDKDYAQKGMSAYGNDGSGVVNTSWALLALSAAKCSDVDAVKKGVKYLMKQQLSSGDFPQQGISGVFNRACGITYTSYRNVFPLWALGRCAATYGDAIN